MAVEGTAVTKSESRTASRVTRLQLRTEKARVLAREPLTVATGTSLRDALDQMRSRGGEAVLVMSGEGLAGILTERDVLTRILGRDLDASLPIDEFMTVSPHALNADAPLFEVMQAMEQGHYRNVPLIDDSGKVVGLLRQQDLLEYVAEAFPEEILNLPPRPHQLMEEPEGA